MKTYILVLGVVLVLLLVSTISIASLNVPLSNDAVALLKPSAGFGLEPIPTETPPPYDLPGERVPEVVYAWSQ